MCSTLTFIFANKTSKTIPPMLTVSRVLHIGSTPQGRYRLAAGKKRYRPCSYKTSRWFLLWSINRLPIHILYIFSVHVFQQLFWSQYSTNGVARYLFIQLFFCNISAGHLLWPLANQDITNPPLLPILYLGILDTNPTWQQPLATFWFLAQSQDSSWPFLQNSWRGNS